MIIITLSLLLTMPGFSQAGGDTNVIATSEWSQPVRTEFGQALRGRMVIAQEHSPAHKGPWPETEFYLDLQNVSDAIGAPMRIYFDVWHNLRCEMRDAEGKPFRTGVGGDGGGPAACWITLPYNSTIRLRANMYGYGAQKSEGLLLMLGPSAGGWRIKAGDTNEYFLSGTFAATPPTNYYTKDFETLRSEWRGTLVLPTMKVYGKEK